MLATQVPHINAVGLRIDSNAMLRISGHNVKTLHFQGHAKKATRVARIRMKGRVPWN